MFPQREVFFIPTKMVLIPKVCSPISCLLHIINNDTGEELDMVFNKPTAQVYEPNEVCDCAECVSV